MFGRRIYAARRSMVAALAAGLAAAGGATAAASPPDPGIGDPHNSFPLHVDGLPSCNCTDERGEYSVCFAESVEVSVGSTSFTVSTGQSSSNCSKHTVKPGQCVFLRYNLMCHQSFWGMSCDLVSVSTMKKPATSFDCPGL